MQRASFLFTHLVSGVLLSSSIATAQSSQDSFPPCGSFNLIGGEFDYVTIDLGLKGESVGDERLGHRELLDSGGSVVGKLRWASRVVELEEAELDKEFSLNQLVYTLPNGTLHASGQIIYVDILAPNTQPTDVWIAVVGGTEDYSESMGEIKATFASDGMARFEFHLRCDLPWQR